MIAKATQDELRMRLEEKKKQLADSVAKSGTFDEGHRLDAEYQPIFPSHGSKEEENATEVAEYQDALSTEETLEKSLEKIDAALERMEKGTYGVCSNCGKEISIERLKAYPEADVCVNC